MNLRNIIRNHSNTVNTKRLIIGTILLSLALGLTLGVQVSEILIIVAIPLIGTWFLVREIKKQLTSFAEAILQDNCVQIDTGFLPELTPLLYAVKAHSQQLRTFEAIVRNSNDLITTVDLDYKITSINPAAQKMYGYTASEALGQEITLLSVPEGVSELKEILERAKIGEEIIGYDMKRRKKDGKVIDVSLSISPIRDDRNRITGIMGIHRDVTERKKMEAEMKRLDALNLIGQMAASIAHEIRNPMTTVHGFLQLLGTKSVLLEYKDYFQLMIEELDRCNSIITEFLSLSRNNPLDLRMQNLNTIINKLLPMIQADALRKELIIIVELEEIPNLKLNEQEIRQVILNLARNALDSMLEGGVLTIRTYLEQDYVVLMFRDQGSGIPGQVLENIGKPFLTTKENGTGLGLPVSYNIVYRHGGTICVETGTTGTTFFIKLPIENVIILN
ncbi:nitrogen regulation protein NR(II) [Desulfosporosinus sp. BICA1-9]|uniref:two-component system sensor histidine kinase NtrB n=1 Tax=Desulfosporosinus sp. BICA1-9 TaxID=1531958 RepID=UPI000A48B464|nr:PAS domain S-box protein [Desulfosporosinus sp. BICA1-9]HBW38922.1 PAS domain-containing sensor histidine kinase [Desulfosporosinus sp.]